MKLEKWYLHVPPILPQGAQIRRQWQWRRTCKDKTRRCPRSSGSERLPEGPQIRSHECFGKRLNLPLRLRHCWWWMCKVKRRRLRVGRSRKDLLNCRSLRPSKIRRHRIQETLVIQLPNWRCLMLDSKDSQALLVFRHWEMRSRALPTKGGMSFFVISFFYYYSLLKSSFALKPQFDCFSFLIFLKKPKNMNVHICIFLLTINF